jgi:hypothetical protein
MKFTTKAFLASAILTVGFGFTACNNAEPDIDDRDGVIEQTLTVGEQFSFADNGYVSDDVFVGDVVDNLTLVSGSYGFRAEHVGTCLVKNDARTYRFIVSSENNAIDPFIEWGTSLDDLAEYLGETSCVIYIDRTKMWYMTGEEEPITEYVFTFENEALVSTSFQYIYGESNPVKALESYLSDRYNMVENVVDGETVYHYYNAATEDAATTTVDMKESSITGTSGETIPTRYVVFSKK